MLQLLELLQSSDTRTMAELAERLDVDERTVRRYVANLVELDIPIESVRGRYGGYRMARGGRVPPLMLADEEAVAVALSLLQAQATADGKTTAARTALAKIQRSLPPDAARRVEAVLSTAVVGTPAAPEETPDPGILLTIADAVRSRRALELRYRDAAEELSRRTLHPHALITRAGRWYVVGLDVARDERRTFRVDRVRTARALPGTFAAPPHSADAAADLEEGFARARYRWHVVLRIRGTVERIRAHLPETVAILTPFGDDAEPWVRAEINAERLDWLPAVIGALEGATVIDEPEELRRLVRTTGERLFAAADGQEGPEPRGR